MTVANQRLAIISATGSGKKRTIPALVASSVDVTAISGRDSSTLAPLAEEFGIAHTFTSIDEMLGSKTFDFVMVCSPPFLHLEHARKVLDAGFPLLLEKPAFLNPIDVADVASIAGAAGLPVRVAHHLRHQDTFAAIRTAIQTGEVGDVESVSMEWSFTLNASAPSSTWKLDAELNGLTSLYDAGIHCVDVSVGLFGPGQVKGVAGSKQLGRETYDSIVMVVDHGGVKVSTMCSRDYGPFSNDLVINGTAGQIVGRDFFTEPSSAAVEIRTRETIRRIDKNSGSAYAAEVIDFAKIVAGDANVVDDGTTLLDAQRGMEILADVDVRLRAGEGE